MHEPSVDAQQKTISSVYWQAISALYLASKIIHCQAHFYPSPLCSSGSAGRLAMKRLLLGSPACTCALHCLSMMRCSGWGVRRHNEERTNCCSFALLAWSALFAEITTRHAVRVRALKYNQIAALLSVNVIVLVEKVSNSLQVNSHALFL